MLIYSDLLEPTYKFQEGETKRAHHYFKIKYEEGLSQRGLEAYLKEKYDEIMGRTWAEPGQLRAALKEYFDSYDIKKALKNYDFEKGRVINPDVIPISKSQISDWSSSECWVPRENDFIHDEEEDDLRAKKAKRREISMSHFESKLNVNTALWERLEDTVHDEKLSQLNQGIQGAIAIDENLDKETGEDNQKLDVKLNADVDSKTEVEANINVEENKGLAAVQAMFMQPEFVELNDKLMNRVADELQKQRNSDG